MYDYSYGQPWLMGICMYGHQCLPVWLLLWIALMVICVLMVALTGYLYMYYCICCFLSKKLSSMRICTYISNSLQWHRRDGATNISSMPYRGTNVFFPLFNSQSNSTLTKWH
ncbi:hypothetical protein PVAP13_6KG370912 [Panicum virgatum]|uniref:Uncharacterized protein n=1 Tax=Panicum virgatum TaxID=38727 RepID=A0A8T0RK50_PANVG|nr:hypothetical protein PVAP13_6KG370912 [Panicum virgatum]